MLRKIMPYRKFSLRKLHIAVEEPEDIIPRLGKPDLHWKAGRSAYCLSKTWVGANGFPPQVQAVLSDDKAYADIEFIAGIFERDTDLRSAGRPSQTDLLVIAALGNSLAVVGVEGKVDEPFGEKVERWNDGSAGKAKRLKGLCQLLGLNKNDCAGLRYQLLHRSAAAIYEAQNFRSHHALMLVHSFSERHAGFDDFQQFGRMIGLPVENPNSLSGTKKLDDVSFRIGWVSDRPVYS